MEAKSRGLKMIRGGFRYHKEPAMLTRQNPITYGELIQILKQNGFEEVQHHQGYVFLRHEESGSLITLPTRNSNVLPPHLGFAMKVLDDIQA